MKRAYTAINNLFPADKDSMIAFLSMLITIRGIMIYIFPPLLPFITNRVTITELINPVMTGLILSAVVIAVAIIKEKTRYGLIIGNLFYFILFLLLFFTSLFTIFLKRPIYSFWDPVAIILTGILLVLLTRGLISFQTRLNIIFLGSCWFLALIFAVITGLVFGGFMIFLVFLIEIDLLFIPVLIMFSYVLSRICMSIYNKFLTDELKLSEWLHKRKIKPEIAIGKVICILILLAMISPPLNVNPVSHSYSGDREIITTYLSMETSQFFPDVEPFDESIRCAGGGVYRIAPNYLGATQRTRYEESVRFSRHRVIMNMNITVIDRENFTRDDMQNFPLLEMKYGTIVLQNQYWSEKWSNNTVYIVIETVIMDNTLGSLATFRQVAAIDSGGELLALFAGLYVLCYD